MHFKVAVLFSNWNILSCYKFMMYLSTHLDYQPPHILIWTSEN